MQLSNRLKGAARLLVRGYERPMGMTWFQAAGEEIERRGIFGGCPTAAFEHTSRDMFCLALMEGLKPSSSVLEVGSGCLRTGYWFIRYLDPGMYCGIEPNVQMLGAGSELILRELDSVKNPRFDHNADFNFSVFDRTFDFVVAFSIWSHSSKKQIGTMLDEFNKNANRPAKLLASWFPPASTIPDYAGDDWVGRSHECDKPGVVAHSWEWLVDAARARHLELRRFDDFSTLGQNWLVITAR